MTDAVMHEDLERIFADDEALQPMVGFSTRVMRAVREEAAAPKPIAFPWSRFLPGLVLNLALLVVTIVWAIVTFGGAPGVWDVPDLASLGPQTRAMLWAAVAMIGSGLLAWLTTRWASPRRSLMI